MNGAARVSTAEVMGTVASIHVLGPGGGEPEVTEAIEGVVAMLRDDERVFSPFLSDSDISRLRTGVLSLRDADPRVEQVRDLCAELLESSDGRFDAWWRGWFDPTGIVKGWSVDRAAQRLLAPLVEREGIDAVGIGVGGDMRLFSAARTTRPWRIGIVNPAVPDALCATIELFEGAVATSGTTERGAHLIDPLRGSPVVGLISATVVAPSLTLADAWATVAALAGVDELAACAVPGIVSGLVTDGRMLRRWSGGIEIVAPDPLTAAA